jgi:F-type H+-transporting ATPase subunit epsilon
MAETFMLEILTPYGQVLKEEVDMVVAPGAEGEFGVLKGHALFITPLKIGEVSYTKGGAREYLATGRGFAEVLPEKTTILVDSAEPGEKIELEMARKEAREAEEALKELTDEDPDFQKATDAFELAKARVEVRKKVKE